MDLEKAKKEFLNYVKSFDFSHFQIERKRAHSLRVMDICTQIAAGLSLSAEEIELAGLVGLLHDIARFEQFTKFQTFNDRLSFDHGDYGVKILKEDNFIRNFIDDNTFDNIIFSAIRNHNKFEIESGLNSQELLFAKIIRDADKLDILYQATFLFWSQPSSHIEEIEDAQIDEAFLVPFLENRPVNRNFDLPNADQELLNFLIMLGFTFDFNFSESFKILKEKDYMNAIIDRFDYKNAVTKEKIEQIRKIINDYIAAHE